MDLHGVPVTAKNFTHNASLYKHCRQQPSCPTTCALDCINMCLMPASNVRVNAQLANLLVQRRHPQELGVVGRLGVVTPFLSHLVP